MQILREVSIAANATNDNILAGSTFEFAQMDQRVSIGVTQSATGLVTTIISGSDIVLEESPPPIKAGYPVIPDEMFFSDVMAKGDRLTIRVRNTTAGALTIRALVQGAPIL